MNNFVMHLGAFPSRAPNLSSVLLLGPPFWCLLALFSKVLLCAGGEHEDTKLCSWGRASWECWALCKERRVFFFFPVNKSILNVSYLPFIFWSVARKQETDVFF